MRRLLLAALALFSTDARATAWTCSNADTAEVTCSSAGCDVREAGDFTPMTVAIDGQEMMDVCTEEGCWSGPATAHESVGTYEVFGGPALKWTQDNTGATADAVLSFDTASGLGTVLVTRFAQPVVCMVHPGE